MSEPGTMSSEASSTERACLSAGAGNPMHKATYAALSHNCALSYRRKKNKKEEEEEEKEEEEEERESKK